MHRGVVDEGELEINSRRRVGDAELSMAQSCLDAELDRALVFVNAILRRHAHLHRDPLEGLEPREAG